MTMEAIEEALPGKLVETRLLSLYLGFKAYHPSYNIVLHNNSGLSFNKAAFFFAKIGDAVRKKRTTSS